MDVGGYDDNFRVVIDLSIRVVFQGFWWVFVCGTFAEALLELPVNYQKTFIKHSLNGI